MTDALGPTSASTAVDKALASAKEAVELAPNLPEALAGQRDAARRVLNALMEESSTAYVAPIIISWIHLQLGDHDAAFDWLNRAYDERSCTFSLGLGSSLYDPIRDDPRFVTLHRKLGLRLPT